MLSTCISLLLMYLKRKLISNKRVKFNKDTFLRFVFINKLLPVTKQIMKKPSLRQYNSERRYNWVGFTFQYCRVIYFIIAAIKRQFYEMHHMSKSCQFHTI